ncbi:hypothetical protein GT037_010651 [Alternaria burnsii]|uniref:DUF676 domain-containing protein n=1 Tax=Alternaria burnsii TaxID=1187904 RepID=A0A8H7AY50_9PLEO|nr:uncharacterized protein GT037_010651 [Alternaria burnsii]KAF7671326.1 hypothetical protein GT037_010651 [Alternaria burnsii]
MEYLNIFQWPWQILQYTIDKWRISGGPSGQDLYQDCNDVIRDFERAFALENGWAVHDKELVFYLQEAALGLKQWKDSIRWCATPDHDCFSEEENEKLVQLVLTSLKEENLGLFETIGQHISDVAKLLVFIEQLYIHGHDEEASRETKDRYFKRLDTALECLAMQLVPLSTYAELVFQPSHTVGFIPIASPNTLQAIEEQKRSIKTMDQQGPAFMRLSSDPMPSPQDVRAEPSQGVAITQDLAPPSNPQVEANSERVAVPQETSGLHILFEPTNTSSDLAIDIIAVPGLGGDGFSTWTDEKSGKLWLRDFLPRSQGFRNARIMTFSYVHLDSPRLIYNVLGWLDEPAEYLLSCIKRTREETNTPRGKPIMFIGHSLGGIIIKMALKMYFRPDSDDILVSTESIIFFGTPCIGREHNAAERDLALIRIFDAAGVKQDESFGASRGLDGLIVYVSKIFREENRGLSVTSFYECRKYHDVLVLEERLARGHTGHETAIGLDANHHTICQFASENDKGFAEVHRAMSMNLIEISNALHAKGKL